MEQSYRFTLHSANLITRTWRKMSSRFSCKNVIYNLCGYLHRELAWFLFKAARMVVVVSKNADEIYHLIDRRLRFPLRRFRGAPIMISVLAITGPFGFTFPSTLAAIIILLV